MRICLCLFLMFLLWPGYATEIALNDALRATYTACVGIDESLHELKVLAGINTAVTSVGTAAGVGAAATGFVKAAKDKEITVKLDKLREIEAKNPNVTSSETDWNVFSASLQSELESAKQEIERYQVELAELNRQSKTLGNWRTGLLAGNTATNIAGAAIAGTNRVDSDLQSQIEKCKSSVVNLRGAIMQARINGSDVSEAETIASACGEYDYVDISKINKRGTGAMVASSVGAATGLAGTVTSGVANSNNVRDNNTSEGKQHEKNLNTAANILSVGATASSLTATVFNATQISAIKQVATVAEKCTGVLK